MAAFYPDEARAAADHAVEVRRDKAQAAERVAQAVAATLKPAKVAKSAPAPVEPPSEAMDPHAPAQPMTLRQMRDRLVRLEREAATNDPPPNAEQRIAALRDRIEQERAA